MAIMTKIHFVVEDSSGCGFIARALGKSIFTETDVLKNLRQQVRDAVHCHFDEGKAPSFIRPYFSRESAVRQLVNTKRIFPCSSKPSPQPNAP